MGENVTERDGKGARRPVRTTLLVALVAVLIGAGGIAWQTGWAADRWQDWRGDKDVAKNDPAAVAAPPEVDVAPVVSPPDVAPPADASAALKASAIRGAVAKNLSARALGPHVLAAVGSLDASGSSYDSTSSGRDLATPASTTKVITSTAALFALGTDHSFATRTVLSGTGKRATVTLIGGGDPFLMASPEPTPPAGSATIVPRKADLTTLATATAKKLVKDGVRRVRLAYDDSLFSGPAANPTWEADYIPDGVVSPITALWVSEGRSLTGFGREADPSASAAAVFGAALRKAGIGVVGGPRHEVAPQDATDVAEVTSAPLSDIVQRVLEVSDNEAAEVLLRHVGVSQEGEGSFIAGQAGVRRVLTANGIKMRGSVLYDGSGLSRDNLMSPLLLLDTIRFAAREDQPDLWPVLAGLPVTGFTGSLTDRMDHADPAALGRVRAKTGTLTGVTSLAGIAVDRDGSLMVFALMADQVRKDKDLVARVAMDNAAAALGVCACTS